MSIKQKEMQQCQEDGLACIYFCFSMQRLLLFLIHFILSYLPILFYCMDELNHVENTFFCPNIAIIIAPVRLQQGSSGPRTVDELCPLRFLSRCCGDTIGSSAELEQWRGGNPTARWPRFIFRILKCTELLKRNIWRCKREGITKHYPPNYTMRRATRW